jgi:hypothetical protein
VNHAVNHLNITGNRWWLGIFVEALSHLSTTQRALQPVYRGVFMQVLLW